MISSSALAICLAFWYWSLQVETSSYYSNNTVSYPTYNSLNTILSQYVDSLGLVNYKRLVSDKALVDSALSEFESSPPSNKWSKEQKKAYWINLYNLLTLKLVVDHYPIKSITELHPAFYIPFLNSVWHQKSFTIYGKQISLDIIEHQILRSDFNDPRIHFAINCASISCPNLRGEAYQPSILDSQLKDQTILFINDSSKNTLTESHLQVSPIFLWFKNDFTNHNTELVNYLICYGDSLISKNATIDFLDYDWDLNEATN